MVRPRGRRPDVRLIRARARIRNGLRPWFECGQIACWPPTAKEARAKESLFPDSAGDAPSGPFFGLVWQRPGL